MEYLSVKYFIFEHEELFNNYIRNALYRVKLNLYSHNTNISYDLAKYGFESTIKQAILELAISCKNSSHVNERICYVRKLQKLQFQNRVNSLELKLNSLFRSLITYEATIETVYNYYSFPFNFAFQIALTAPLYMEKRGSYAGRIINVFRIIRLYLTRYGHKKQVDINDPIKLLDYYTFAILDYHESLLDYENYCYGFNYAALEENDEDD
jgi:hypothetical protein